MASKNKDERAYVNALVKAIQKNSPGVHVHIDRDAGGVRHTSSGWDFMLACHGLVVFCEAKIEKGKLSDWQEYVRAAVLASKTPYFIVRFCADGTWFSIDGEEPIKTEEARITNFLKI